MLLRKTFRFEASHLLPKHPGKCSRLHGHSWVLHVEIQGPVNVETGFVMDYADISKVVKPIVDSLDHRHLGAWCVYENDRMDGDGRALLAEVLGTDGAYFNDWYVPNLPKNFYPTSENLLYWLAEELAKQQFKWSKVALEETCTSYAELALDEFMRDYTNKYGLDAAQLALANWR